MDPIEQKTPHLYPNADRDINNDVMVGNTNTTVNNTERPLVHLSDVLSRDKKVEIDSSYKTSTVHTFKDDMASEASKDNFSIGKIMAANSRKAHSTPMGNSSGTNTAGKNKKVVVIVAVSILCILIIGGFSYVGYNSSKLPAQVVIQNNENQQIVGGLLYSEQKIPIDLTGKNRTSLFAEISQSSSIKIPTGKVASVMLTYKEGSSTKTITASNFLNIIAPTAPDALTSNLKDGYVFGYYSYETNEPFIILESNNYDSSFAGMLDWEKSMYADLGDLIFKPKAITSAVGTTTKQLPTQSTKTTTSSTAQKQTITQTVEVSTPTLSEYDTPFVDKIISNNDTRVLYRPNGQIAMFYTFFNKNTIIIATSEQSLREIIYRLTTGKITR